MRKESVNGAARLLGVLCVLFATLGCTVGSATYAPDAPHSSAAPGSASSPAPDLVEPEAFWAALIPGDPEAVSYGTLAALVSASDAVVVGTVSGISSGPTVEDSYTNIIYWATLTIRVDEILAGSVRSSEPGVIRVSLLLGVGDKDHDFDERYQQFAGSLPQERAMLFLSNNQEWAKEYGIPLDSPEANPFEYRVLGGQGYLREVGGLAVLPERPVGDWPNAFDRVPFEDVVAAVRGAAATSE